MLEFVQETVSKWCEATRPHAHKTISLFGIVSSGKEHGLMVPQVSLCESVPQHADSCQLPKETSPLVLQLHSKVIRDAEDDRTFGKGDVTTFSPLC